MSGLSNNGCHHKIPITFCHSSDGFHFMCVPFEQTKPKHPSLPPVLPRLGRMLGVGGAGWGGMRAKWGGAVAERGGHTVLREDRW